MNLRSIIACLLVWRMALAADAEQLKCEICGQLITGKYYHMDDHAVGGSKNVCKECEALEEKCFACGLPIKTDYKTLPDGRLLCARDAQDAIEAEDEVRQICESVRDDLNRSLWRFLTIPTENVIITVVDRFQLQSLFKSPGYEQACVSIFGATQSHALPGGKFVHSISLLSHVRKSRLMAVCAHELTHTWLNENLKPERKAVIDPQTIEGFCELVAYKYMENRQESFEMEVIRTSEYTKGQITVLLEAEKIFGLNTVVDWMKAGEDAKLESSDLDRIRLVNANLITSRPTNSSSTGLVVVPAPVPTPVPETLVLKGISGTPQRRFALINDRTFERMERGRVRFGNTNVWLRCLEIREHSVVIQAEGSNERKELVLPAQ